MSGASKIEWTDCTWNPVTGCTKVSPGCKHCYAEAISQRFGRDFFKITLHPERLDVPLHWRKPRMVFVNSMSDLFHDGVPFEFIDRVFAVMALAPQHTFQVLTKRPQRMAEYFQSRDKDGFDTYSRVTTRVGRELLNATPPHTFLGVADFKKRGAEEWSNGQGPWPLKNAWLGTSVENQACADQRIPHLLQYPAAVRFLSCEPLLGPIDLMNADGDGLRGGLRGALHWVIVGGESGPGARPCNLAWILSIVQQCQAAQVPVFVKQLGSVVHVPYYTDDSLGYFDDLREWALDHRGRILEPTRRRAGDGYIPGWVEIDPRIDGQPHTNCVYEFRLPHKGGRIDDWHESLRIREWPTQNAECRIKNVECPEASA